MYRLSDDDCRAVDVLLDSRKTSRGINSNKGILATGTACLANTGTLDLRLAHLEQLLDLLQELPAGDPPRSLVNRTLQAVESRPTLLNSGPEAPSATDLGAQA